MTSKCKPFVLSTEFTLKISLPIISNIIISHLVNSPDNRTDEVAGLGDKPRVTELVIGSFIPM